MYGVRKAISRSKKYSIILHRYINVMLIHVQSTPQPFYNTVRYNTVLGITRFKDGSQHCINYIEK